MKAIRGYLYLLGVCVGWAFSSPAFALATNDACNNLPKYETQPSSEGQDPISQCSRAANEALNAAKSDRTRGDNFAASMQTPAAAAGASESQSAGSEGLVQQGQDLEQKKTNAVTAYTSCQTNAGLAAERWAALKNAAAAASHPDSKDFEKLQVESTTLAGSCKSKATSTQSFTGGRDMQNLGKGRGVGDDGKAKDPKSKESDDKVSSSGSGGMSGALMPALLGAVGGGIAGYMFGKSKATTETATTTKTETASNTNTATDTSDKIDCTKLGLATNTDGTCMAATATGTGTTTASGNVVVNGVAQDTTGNNSNTTNSPSQTLPASSSGGPNVGGAVSQTGSSGTTSNTATNSGTYVQNSLSGKSSSAIAALNATGARAQSATATDTATGGSSALAAPSGGGGASWRRNLSDEEAAASAGANPLNYNYIDGGRSGRSLAGGNVQSTLNRIENPDCNSSSDAARVACQNERKAQDRAQLAVYCSRYPGASKCRNLDE